MNGFAETDTSEAAIDIKEYFYLFRAWAWLIILAGLLAGVAAFIVSARTRPVYQASTRLLVSAPSTINGVDPSAMVTTQMMTSTYSEMLLDRPVLQGVIDQLKLHITAENLKKSIKVDVVTNTQLLVVTVANTNPALAADIANGIAAVFTDRIRQLQSQRFAASRDGLAKQVSDMEGQITDTNNQIVNTTDPSTLQQLQARLTQYRTIYSSLVTTYEQVRLAEEQTSTNVIVSEPANVPSVPVRPKTITNILFSVISAMFMVVGMVFVSHKLDDTIKNPEDIRRKFNLPILGVIDLHKVPEDKPITLDEPYSRTVEAFRSLRTNILFASVDSPLRRILITSTTPQEGKSTIASNLAVVLAQGEKKTLLIDADLRRPSIHIQFGLPNRTGLTNLFYHPLDPLSGMTQSVNVPGLAVMTSGILPPNPSELLTSKTMDLVLDQLNQVFELIVIDSPPVLTVTDAAALAPSMDGVILVVKSNITKLTAIHQALEQLNRVGAHVLGIVLNEVNPTAQMNGYYYHSYSSEYSNPYQKPSNGKKKTRKLNKMAKVEPD